MIEGAAEKAGIAEVSCYNPRFLLQSCLPLLFQNLKEHPVIEGTVEEACIAEVSCYNPSFPVTKLFISVIAELQRTPLD